jgi:hypothetical protein
MIGRDCDITVVRQSRISCNNIYQISCVILDVKCESQYPLVQATKSGAALKAVPTCRSVSETR